MNVFVSGSPAEKKRQPSESKETESSQNSAPDSGGSGVKTFSLTRRIIISVVTCQLLLTLGLILVAVLYAREQLRGTFDAGLDGDARAALALVRYTEMKPYVLMFDSELLPPVLDQAHQDLYEIRGEDGHLIARSKGWQAVPPELARTSEQYLDFTMNGAPYRAAIMRNAPVLDSESEGDEDDGPPAKVTLFYAESLVDNHARLTKLAVYVGLTSLLLLGIANSFAISSIRRGLYPLHELADRAGAISVHHWDFRALPDTQLASELAPLATAIETVLSRLKTSFGQQRNFTNDAAHELKTSVAILKSTLQSLLHRPRTQREYEIGLEGVLDDCARLEDLIERMLRLARIEQLTENGAPRKHAMTELTSTCEAAIARIRALAEERNVSLEFEGPLSIPIHADPEDLELIWLNLLENAVQYSPAGVEGRHASEPQWRRHGRGFRFGFRTGNSRFRAASYF